MKPDDLEKKINPKERMQDILYDLEIKRSEIKGIIDDYTSSSEELRNQNKPKYMSQLNALNEEVNKLIKEYKTLSDLLQS